MLSYVARASAGFKVWLPSSASPTPRQAPSLARDKCILTAFGRVKSGLKPAVKNRAMHGGEECAARMVKTKADALGIGGQTPSCGAV